MRMIYFLTCYPMDFCTTRPWQTSGRLVQEFNACTGGTYGVSAIPGLVGVRFFYNLEQTLTIMFCPFTSWWYQCRPDMLNSSSYHMSETIFFKYLSGNSRMRSLYVFSGNYGQVFSWLIVRNVPMLDIK